MPISRIKTDGIQDDAVTSPKLGHNPDFDGQYVVIPHGTTAQRPGSPSSGFLRFNTDLGTLEQYNTSTNAWQAIDSPPIITNLAYTGSKTGADPAGGETITLTGSNFKSGATVTIGGTSASSVSVVSATSITFTTPAKSAGDYDVKVTNTNGLSATLTDGISYNGVPAFSTSAGNVGSIASGEAMSTITIVASEPDGGTLAFSITSGALPSGLSFGSANGQITGTPASVATDTTFNFTVTATDDENQTNARAFNLIVLRPVYARQINQSLMFDGAASALVRTQEAASTTYTWSGWIKRSALSTDYEIFWSSNNNIAVGLWHNVNDMRIYVHSGGSNYTTVKHIRDTMGWFHLVFQNNAGTFTIWVNGEQYYQGSIGQALSTTTNATTIGRFYSSGSGAYYFDGYMADIHFVDGQAKAPTDFAASYNGVWTPIAYTGTFGTGGYKLEFADSSAIGDDTSGNNNDMSTGGITSDHKKIDSPTINMCTYNTHAYRRDVNNYRPEYYFGNTKISYPNAGGNQTYGFGTHAVSSGKWYFEIYMSATGTNTNVGLGTQGDINAQDSHNCGYRNTGAVTSSSGSSSGNGASYATGDIISIAYDLDAGTVRWWKNNTLQSTITGFNTTNSYMPFIRGTTSENNIANWGQDSTFGGSKTSGSANAQDANGIGNFYYAPPTGHLALCGKNLPDGPLNVTNNDRPDDYFNVAIYSGTDAAQDVTGVGFRPDFVWIKNRTTTGWSWLVNDSVRGPNNLLFTDAQNANTQNNGGGYISAFGSDGFSVTGGGASSKNGSSHVAYCWKAGGAPTATNSGGQNPTSGSVMVDGSASTAALASSNIYPTKMSVNTKAGFSIVQYTGNGTNNADVTIPHGLSARPDFIWVKNMTRASTRWQLWHTSLNASGSYETQNILFTTTADDDYSSQLRIPTATHIEVRDTNANSNSHVNRSGDSYMAYCWHNVVGFSKMGKYLGTGAANYGPYIDCGFKPAFVLFKSNDTTNRWVIHDNRRTNGSSTTSVDLNPIMSGAELNPNTASSAEGSGSTQQIDFYSSGFRILRTGDVYNTAGHVYIFMAFAEDPFKFAEAR